MDKINSIKSLMSNGQKYESMMIDEGNLHFSRDKMQKSQLLNIASSKSIL